MRFVKFYTHGHSGHTAVAAALDAHPQVAISNSYGDNSSVEKLLISAAIEDKFLGSKYDYRVQGQGKWRDLRLMGTTELENPDSLGMQPFRITTIRDPKLVISSTSKKLGGLAPSIESYRRKAGDIDRKSDFLFFIWHEVFCKNARMQLSILRRLLDLDDDPLWIDRCCEMIREVPAGAQPEWSAQHLDELKKIKEEFWFLRRYA